MGGGASPIMSPPHDAEKEIPPSHTEKMAWPPRTWREKTAHIKNTPIGETPPTWIFFIHAPPPGERLYPPLACADHDLHSLYSVCLKELEKNQQ